MELGVFYFRRPLQKNGIITSVTFKKMLTVTGNGYSTVEESIKNNNRSFLQYQKLKKNNTIDFSYIPPAGQEQVLVPYGNHVLGATFLNYNHIIDKQLTNTIDAISKRINGFYFGRYDLRCSSIEDLKIGKNFSILEINGAGAEPAHIYEPGFSFIKAQLILARHFNMLYQVATENNRAGVQYMSYEDFRKTQHLESEKKSKSCMNIIGIPIGLCGYLFPSNINIMVLDLYVSKKYKLLVIVLLLIIIFESIYCLLTLLFLGVLKENDIWYKWLEAVSSILILGMGAWMLLESKVCVKAVQKNTLYRGITNTIIHPQQIPFWLIIGMVFNPAIKFGMDLFVMAGFLIYNATDMLMAMSIYMFFGSKILKYFNLNLANINFAMGMVYFVIGSYSLLNFLI